MGLPRIESAEVRCFQDQCRCDMENIHRAAAQDRGMSGGNLLRLGKEFVPRERLGDQEARNQILFNLRPRSL